MITKRCRGSFTVTRITLLLFAASVLVYVALFVRDEQRISMTRADRSDTRRQTAPDGIPHRIHQMYRDENIPKEYQPLIKSWVKHHPSWEYWFWSDQDARRLIMDHYPQYLKMYDSYSNNLFRSDAARYFILYHFGGVYADMDMESFRSLDSYLTNFSCLLSQEPYAQSQLLWNKPKICMNAWMASVKRHPFMDYVLRNLQTFAKPSNILNAIFVTGPVMLQQVLDKFRSNSSNCDNGTASCSASVAPANLFMPTWDPMQANNFKRMCKNKTKLSKMKLGACQVLENASFKNRIPDGAYANHKFLHIGYQNGQHKSGSNSLYISRIVPKVYRYAGKGVVLSN